MADKLVVGVWQGRCSESVKVNCARAAEVIDEAVSAGCDFVCLPEMFLTGYGTPQSMANALDREDPCLYELAQRAGARGLVTLVGLAEKRGADVWNTQLVLADGAIAGAYSKALLTGGEISLGIKAGDEFPVFEAKGVCFAIQICHDSSFPEVASIFSWKGARLLFSPHFNCIPREAMNEHRVRVRNNHIGAAAHYSLVVARSNVIAAADARGRLGYGDSAIFSPAGEVLAEAGLFTEKLICVDVASHLKKSYRNTARTELRPAIIEQNHAAALQALGHLCPEEKG